jgi:hypothetical protein
MGFPHLWLSNLGDGERNKGRLYVDHTVDCVFSHHEPPLLEHSGIGSFLKGVSDKV